MNNWMLPFAVLLADGKKGGAQSSEIVESMIVSAVPQGPRTVLTVTQAIDRANQQESQQKATRKREEQLANLIKDGKITVTADLSNEPRMQYLVSKISDAALKATVISKIKTPGTIPTGPTNTAATSEEVSSLPRRSQSR